MVNVKNNTELNARVQYLGEFIEVPAGKTVSMKKDEAEFIVKSIGFLVIEEPKVSTKSEKKVEKVEVVEEDK